MECETNCSIWGSGSGSYDEFCHLKYNCCACYLLHASSLFDVCFDSEDGGDYVPPKHRLASSGLHGIITQRWNPSWNILFKYYKILMNMYKLFGTKLTELLV
jgi:hypothetical protein